LSKIVEYKKELVNTTEFLTNIEREFAYDQLLVDHCERQIAEYGQHRRDLLNYMGKLAAERAIATQRIAILRERIRRAEIAAGIGENSCQPSGDSHQPKAEN